jgi:hypothetical protein
MGNPKDAPISGPLKNFDDAVVRGRPHEIIGGLSKPRFSLREMLRGFGLLKSQFFITTLMETPKHGYLAPPGAPEINLLRLGGLPILLEQPYHPTVIVRTAGRTTAQDPMPNKFRI